MTNPTESTLQKSGQSNFNKCSTKTEKCPKVLHQCEFKKIWKSRYIIVILWNIWKTLHSQSHNT